MNFQGEARRGSLLRATLYAFVLGAFALLAACGGGERSTTFTPARVITFGDENSAIVDLTGLGDGRKYTVNYVSDTDLSIDCTSNPIWVEALSQTYGLRYPQCDPTQAGSTGVMLAANGAETADVGGQIDQFLTTDQFHGNDLVTVMAGMNDIINLYKQYPAQSEATLTAEAEVRGTNLANQVNRIANLGGKVIISTIYDLGASPFAGVERVAHTDLDRAALISRLTTAFNTKLRVGILNDGRKIGLILTDELINTIVRFPTSTSYVNVTDPVCDSALVASGSLNCTIATLVANGSAESWLWADQIHLAIGANRAIGQLAASRAINNPF